MQRTKMLFNQGATFFYQNPKLLGVFITLQVFIFVSIKISLDYIFSQSHTKVSIYIYYFLVMFFYTVTSILFRLIVLHYIHLLETENERSLSKAVKLTFSKYFIKNITFMFIFTLIKVLYFLNKSDRKREQSYDLESPTAGALLVDKMSSSVASHVTEISVTWMVLFATSLSVVLDRSIGKTYKNVTHLISKHFMEIIRGTFTSGFKYLFLFAPIILGYIILLANPDNINASVLSWTIAWMAFALFVSSTMQQIYAMLLTLWYQKWRLVAKEAIQNDEEVPSFESLNIPSILDDIPYLEVE